MKKVLILHGWFATPDDHWYKDLAVKLEKDGYKVTIPELKDKDFPTLNSWKKCATENFIFDRDTTIIGHSLGASLALNILQNLESPIDRLITVSGWDYWDLTPEHETFFPRKFDYEKIIGNTQERFAIHSDCDPYVTEFIAGEYAKRIDAKFIIVPGAKHFIKEDGADPIDEIVKIMK